MSRAVQSDSSSSRPENLVMSLKRKQLAVLNCYGCTELLLLSRGSHIYEIKVVDFWVRVSYSSWRYKDLPRQYLRILRQELVPLDARHAKYSSDAKSASIIGIIPNTLGQHFVRPSGFQNRRTHREPYNTFRVTASRLFSRLFDRRLICQRFCAEFSGQTEPDHHVQGTQERFASKTDVQEARR